MNLYTVIFLLFFTVMSTTFWLKAWRDDRDPAPPVLTLIAFAVVHGLGYASGWVDCMADIVRQLSVLQP